MKICLYFYNYVPPFGQGQDQYRQLFEDYKGNGKREFIFNETLGAYNSSVAAFAEKAEGYPTILTYMSQGEDKICGSFGCLNGSS